MPWQFSGRLAGKAERGLRSLILGHQNRGICSHFLSLDSPARRIELDADVHRGVLPKAEMPLGLRVGIVTVRTLTVHDHHLFKPKPVGG